MVVFLIGKIESSIEKLSLAEVKSIFQKYEQRLTMNSRMSFEFNGRMCANCVKQNNNFGFEHKGVRLGGMNDNSSVFFVNASQS